MTRMLTLGSIPSTFSKQCETFSRSGTAVFELSTRFGDLFKYKDGADEAAKEAARKLLFLELTQGESCCCFGRAKPP
jgi:hypothetical protein